VLAESEDFPHLVQALDAVLGALGGTARKWRFDRMATVCLARAAFSGPSRRLQSAPFRGWLLKIRRLEVPPEGGGIWRHPVDVVGGWAGEEGGRSWGRSRLACAGRVRRTGRGPGGCH
jgi:hypothetical protein